MRIMISRFQFYLLTINFIIGTTPFVMLQGLIAIGKQDAWIWPILTGGAGVLAGLFWLLLFRHYPGRSLVQIPLEAMGRFPGAIVSFLFFVYFCNLSGWILRNLSDFLNGTIMPATPAIVFHITFLLVVCYTVAQGAECVVRLNQIVTPLLFFPFWVVFLLATVNWNWERFEPVLYLNPVVFFRHPAFLGFPFLETISLTMLFPHVQKGPARPFLLGILTASVSLSILVFVIIGLLGAERASQLTYPVYTAIQEVAIGEALVNIHSVISVILLVLIFIKLLVLVYSASETLQQVVRPRTRWPHFLSLMILLTAIAHSMYENPVQNAQWSEEYSICYNAFFTIAIPALLLAVTWIKRAYQKRQN